MLNDAAETSSVAIANGSVDGNWARKDTELLEGDANTIGPGEAGVLGDGGVKGVARAESVLEIEVSRASIKLNLFSEGSGTERSRRGSNFRRAA